MPKIEIQKLYAGYKLTAYPQRALALTAQDLRDIYDWCLLHMTEIEAEAKKYEQTTQKEEPK